MLDSCRVLCLFVSLVAFAHAEPSGEAARIIQQLKMERIPDEGAWFAATYRSADTVPTQVFGTRYQGAARIAGSAIYALATREDFSALHRLETDEIWHYYRGDPLELLLLYPDGRGETVVLGSDVLKGQRPQVAVPRGVWQGARPVRSAADAYTLFGCTLAPGFEYPDLTMGYRDELQRAYPRYTKQIAQLTRPAFVKKPTVPSTSAAMHADVAEHRVLPEGTVAKLDIRSDFELRELLGRGNSASHYVVEP